MPHLPRGPQTLYSAVILAALVALIVVARRQQGEPTSAPSRRAFPEPNLLNRVATNDLPKQPRPLVIGDAVLAIPSPESAFHPEMPVGFPDDESDNVGPITQEEATVYGPVAETRAAPALGIRRLAPLEDEDSGEPAATLSRTPPTPRPAESIERPAAPKRSQTVNDDGLRPVLQQAAQLNRQAESLARRGAYYLARNLTIQSLRTISEALDLQTGSGEHIAALASALTALREVGDFQSRSGEDSPVSVPLVVAGHRTPVLRQQNAVGMSAVTAQQQYYNFARKQFVVAAGGQTVASNSLCNLGKLQSKMGDGTALPQTNLARAMVCHQAALAVDHRNYPAANELGVILTNFGQLQDARRVLLHSVGTVSSPDGWHNLAVVHERLGETELADHAHKQVELGSAGAAGPRPKIEWVSPDVFAGKPPTEKASAAVATSTGSDLRSADSRPKQKETWISPFGSKR